MSEKHFYAQSHIRGGFTIDEAALDDNDGYWQGFAEGTLKKLAELTPAADDLVAGFWHDGNTWKFICESVERVIADVRAGLAEQKHICNDILPEMDGMLQTLYERFVLVFDNVDPEIEADQVWLSGGEPSAIPNTASEDVHVIGLGVDFNITKIGESIQENSAILKSRIDARMDEAKQYMQQRREIIRQSYERNG